MSLFLQMMIPVAAGFVLDLLLGDPHSLYHPVRLMGKMIAGGEKIIRGCFPETILGERIGGILLTFIIILIWIFLPAGALKLCYQFSFPFGLLAESFLCYQMLALKSLKDESYQVYLSLKQEGLPSARQKVSMIVGRDTKQLSEEGVVRATVETVAENTSDGVIAPLFYMILGGAILGFGYKAVNTMDSMIGYRNTRYQYFGTGAAKFDDILNWLPARLSAACMLLASRLVGLNGSLAWHIYQRDRKKHKSPNAAQTESVAAGALELQLAGDAWYFGVLHHKPVIGDARRSPQPEDILRMHRLLYTTTGIAFFFLLAGKGILLSIILL